MYKRHRASALLLAVSIVTPLLLIEIGLVIAGHDPLGNLVLDSRGLFLRQSTHRGRIYELTPNSQSVGWNTEVKVNRYGFRDDVYSIKKSKDVYRIVVIGDSITFGNGIAIQDTYPSRLEIDLQQTAPVEVLNLGLGGYDTLQEVATLEHLGMQFEPDLVIVGYCMNDIGIESANLAYIKRVQRHLNSPFYRLRLVQLVRSRLDRVFARRENRRVNNEKAFIFANKDVIANVDHDSELERVVDELQKNAGNKKALQHTLKWYRSKARIGKLRHSFEKLKTLQDNHGFEVTVMIVPYIEDRELYQLAYKIVENEASRLSFDVLNLYSDFRTAGFNKLRRSQRDGIHPNELGHEIMAARLRDHLISNVDFLQQSK